MGVTQLWQILSPVQEHQTLASLKGLVLAVDLSIWICESDGVRNMQGVVTKPHLRNLFFRILHLTQLGVKLVFVIEGAAPELKWDTMAKRQQSRFPGRQAKQPTSTKPSKQSRKNFNAILKECCELLDILGIPYIQSKGEAEAMCAVLNSAGLVDGCLTDDGDAFLYGAQTVYRNFTMNAKDPHVECYRVGDIESQLGIDRNGLVALALLLGCDFVPKGVPGIGMASAVKLIECLRGRNVLERLQDWRKIHESQCVDQVEKMVRKKALNAVDFPQTEVIHEFLHPKDRCPSSLSPWKRPVPVKLQEFALQKLDWPLEYTLEKILPLVTLWDMQDALQSKNPSNHQHLRPHRIVKTRIRQGVPCYEIEWHKPVTDPSYDGDYYLTIETQEMFTKCYPTIVRLFQGETTSKNKKKKAKKKKAKEKANESIDHTSVETLSFNFGKLNLKKVTNRLQESVHELKPSFTEYEGSALTTKVKQSSVPQSSQQIVQPSSHIQSNSVKPIPVLNTSVAENDDNSDIPLTDRIKLRLQKKQQQNQIKNNSVDAVCKGMEDLNINNNHSLSNRKKKKRTSNRINNNAGENSAYSERVSSLKNSAIGSPVSPFVCETMSSLRRNQVDNMRKMSSPASGNTFCSPVSYMKQSIQDNTDKVFKDSPIQNMSIAEDSYQQKRTLTNFKFFDTPIRDENHATSSIPAAPTNGVQKLKTPSILKGEWQTEFIESYIHELSKDFSLSADRSLQLNKQLQKNTGLTNSTAKSINKSNINTDQLTNQLTMDATQEINFKLQSSLLDSLCASLIQTLTPKGMNKEQYDSLCESLKKLEQEGTDLAGLKDLPCNLDFSDLEELSSSFKLPNKPNNHTEKNQLHDKGSKQKSAQLNNSEVDCVNGLGKSARKRLRKKQKVSTNISTTTQQKNCGNKENIINHGSNLKESGCQGSLSSQSQDVVDVSLVDYEYSGARKCSSIGANNFGKMNESTKQKPVSQTMKHNGQCENKSTRKGINTEVSSNEVSKKKKKNKKKKVKKTFTDMDISTDTSGLNEFQYKMCSEYLKKALEGGSKSKPQPKKIEKASPVIDLSADETFLELEVLSGNLANSASTSNTEAKRKLALKRKLSKKPKEEDRTEHVCIVDQNQSAQPGVSSQDSPLLSVNAAMSPSSYRSGHTNHQERSPHKANTVCRNHQNGHGTCSNHESKVEAIRLNNRVCKQALLELSKTNNTTDRTHVETGNTSRYDRDFLDAMEEVIARASPALLSPKSPGKTCNRVRQRMSDSEMSPKAAVKERCKSKRSPPYCRMNAGPITNETGIPDTYERNIQSCKDLRSWSVLPKMISKEYLRCQAGISGSLMDYRLQSRFRPDDSEPFESAAKMYCNMNEKHVRNIGIEMEKIDCELKAANKLTVNETDSDLDKSDSEVQIDDARDNEVCIDDRNENIDCELKTAYKQITVETESFLDKSDLEKHDVRDNESSKDGRNGYNDCDTGIIPPKFQEASESGFCKKIVEIAGRNTSDDVEPLNDNDLGNEILTANLDKENNVKENSDGLSDTSDNVDIDYSSCTEEFITDSKDNDVLYKNDYDDDKMYAESDVIVVEDCLENGVNKLSENIDRKNQCANYIAATHLKNNVKYVIPDDTAIEQCIENDVNVTSSECFGKNNACANNVIVADELNTDPDVIVVVDDHNENGDDEISDDSIDRNNECSNSIITATEQLPPIHPTALIADAVNITENEGSSDKENERVVESIDVLMTMDSCSGSAQDIPTLQSSSMLSGSDKVDDSSSSEKVSSPIPLLDRLKMKFKKSSARNVLQTFTNGR